MERAKGFEPSTPTLARLCSILPVGSNHRTDTEHPATILLPNSVAADDTSRHMTDNVIKIPRENKTLHNRPLQGDMAQAAFRVRCIRPTLQFSKRRRGPDRPAPGISAFAGRGGGVCLHGGLRQDRHSIQVRMRTLLGIGGHQDRGVRSQRGSKLTGIRQGKSRRRIKIITQNQ